MSRFLFRRMLLCLSCVGILAWGAPSARAGEPPAAADSSRAPAQPQDPEVARAVQAYWPMLAKGKVGAACQTGYVDLLWGDLNGARKVFQEILSHDKKFAPAQYGLALASYRLGQKVGTHGAYSEQSLYHAQEAASLTPGFEGSYLLMGRMHLQREAYKQAVKDYVHSLVAKATTDTTVLRPLCTAYIRTGVFSQMDEQVVDSLLVTTDPADLFAMTAQACMDQKVLGLAQQYFGLHLSRLSAKERKLYQDISLIASKEEMASYNATAGNPEARREFLVRFWASRDPDLLTAVNERRLEHYRRVWFARKDFARHAKPWDKRGDVYVRYGPPDYWSSSGRAAEPMSPSVERVKEEIAYQIYGSDGVQNVTSAPVYPILLQRPTGMDFPVQTQASQNAPTAPQATDQAGNPLYLDPGQAPALPNATTDVTLTQTRAQLTAGGISYTRWESWVYTGVAGGIEIVFTDDWSSGNFDYAPVPTLTNSEKYDVREMGRLVHYAPAQVMARSIQQMPDFYLPGGREAFLDFYYDRADFRGQDGKTRVEVYFGMPPGSFARPEKGDHSPVRVGCAAALFNPVSGETIQKQEELSFRPSSAMTTKKGAFIPSQLTLEVPPGTYDLRVQVKDLSSGRSGIYKEKLKAENYNVDSLRISDLEMGWKISTEGGLKEYQKGKDIWVIPMTTKDYRKGQNPSVYYEVYGLTKNTFGRSRFKLQYTIQSEPEKGSGLGRFLASVGRLFNRNRAPEVSVSAEQVRSETNLHEYLELNLSHAKPGVNRLTIRVTDENSGESAEKDVLFRYDRD